MTKTILFCILVFLGLITLVTEISPRLRVGERAVSATTSPFANVSPRPIANDTQVASVAYDPVDVGFVATSAMIGVQPSEAAPGESVLLSWTSVGQSFDSPCTIHSSGRLVAEGNEGTIKILVPQIAASSTLEFTLRCVSPEGDSTRKSTQVRVLPTWPSNEE